MSKLTTRQDASGQAMWDHYQGKGAFEIAERDDGYIEPSGGPASYFSEYELWPTSSKKAVTLVKGKVLDVGCGAGRVALHLQSKSIDVTGIDNSPLAIKVCKLRGLKKARLMSITQLSRRLGVFDTVIMYGNNFGLFGSLTRARWLLRRLHGMTTPAARIIAETLDPYQTNEPVHRVYHRGNQKRGRMGGQVRICIRYKQYATPWFDYLFVSKKEVQRILRGTGWTIDRFIDSRGGRYVAIIKKEVKP